MSKIACLSCGKSFVFLPPHLAKAHGVTADEYRSAYGLPAGTPLCSPEYSEQHAVKMRRMQATGALTYTHLPEAVEAARESGRGQRTADDLAAQSRRARATQPWNVAQLKPGAKRADGRDADRAREYQREYRRRKAQAPGT